MQICFLGIATALNVVGANLALLLRLPIYLDSLGTVLSAVMLGPVSVSYTHLDVYKRQVFCLSKKASRK